MKPILIIKAGAKLPELAKPPTRIAGDFEDWIGKGLAASHSKDLLTSVVRVYKGEQLPAHENISGIVITGSSAMVTDQSDWIEDTASWLKQAVDQSVPVLGICFGHQLLAYALGGVVADNPAGVEVGTVPLQLHTAAKQDTLLADLGETCFVQMSHRQVVTGLPAAAVTLARTAQTEFAAYRATETAWGVQFHPEFDDRIIAAYINYYANDLLQQQMDINELQGAAIPTVASQQILARFMLLCQQ